MKKLQTYIKGGLIGMIAEYCFRVDYSYLQIFILVALVIGMVIEVIQDWNK